MIRIILAFDEQDVSMGSFNRGCLESYQEYFGDNDERVTIIKSAQLNELNIKFQTDGKQPFIFTAYSHGNQNGELHSINGVYLSTTVNNTLFTKTFVYTVSCHSGKKLGEELVNNGCTTFFGYKTVYQYWDGYVCFPECANFGFFLFIEGQRSNDIYNEMITKYNDCIDKTYQENYLVASLLRDNRDALIHLGEDVNVNSLFD